MDHSPLLMEMTWPEIQKAIREHRVLLFCVGAIEQHGPHLPTGVDVYLPMEVALRTAQAVNAIVAPCTNYGYKSLLRSGGGPYFVGSIGMRGTTVIAMVKDILSELISQGWRNLVVLDWHLEGIPFVFEGADEAIREAPAGKDVKLVKVDNICGLAMREHPELQRRMFGDDFPGWAVEHAAINETSLMLAARPDLVHMDRAVDGEPPQPFDYDVLPVPRSAAPASGVFWKATRASHEVGCAFMDALSDTLVQIVRKEFPVRE